MTRIGLLLVSCMVVFVVGAIAASSASATFTQTEVECSGTTGVATTCISATETGKLFEAKGSETITGVKAVKNSVLKVTSLELTIECTADSLVAEVNQGSPLTSSWSLSTVIITLTGCDITGSAALAQKCEVTTGIRTNSMLGTALSPSDIEIEGTISKLLTEILITNKGTESCPSTVKSFNPVKGNQVCTLPSNAAMKVKHLLNCAAAGSSEGKAKLEFGTNAATFEAEAEYELSSKKYFDDGTF